jgi:hypothetical protein
LEASNSIFEVSGLIKYLSTEAAGEEDETGAASLVTALGLSAAGLAQEQTSKRLDRIVRIKLERIIDISPAERSVFLSGNSKQHLEAYDNLRAANSKYQSAEKELNWR